MICHSAGPISDGWGVIDFWESREAFDGFVASRMRPAMQELGGQTFASAPDVKEFAVHHILTEAVAVGA
jgi:heme-degrading monooxygenase HmoA